ncbi:LuxR C-terminal-related transcriptional regulator [Marispirochaeta aestuarii]|uniref:helix-turn-helix transcriptional regulator n=1 Tax=Marispirochaeta aestuarii TaxID=1963862 RepID=UPI002ABD18EB|nr:LuxR C-terminal-related transcriptional regulator [Marispirochaeta aestuarii]
MFISSGVSARTQHFVESLYMATSEDDLLDRIIPQLADIVPSDYSGILFLPSVADRKILFSEQGPSDLIKQDNTCLLTDIVLHQNAEPSEIYGGNWFINGCRKVVSTAQRWQFPVIVRSRMAGVFIMARTGSDALPYTDDELELAAFLISFIADGLEKVFMPFPLDDWAGFLDTEGNVLAAGKGMHDFFNLFFGDRYMNAPQRNPGLNGTAYRKCLKGFSGYHPEPGTAELVLKTGFCARRFILRLLSPSRLQPFFSEIPRFDIRLLNEPGFHTRAGLDASADCFALSSREMQIIGLLFRGCSNREISVELGITIPTVKHHLYNIYNKTGADSRTHLIMLLEGTGA